jgi:putative transcriptional regulator
VLRAIAEGRGPSRWLIALGYAGWGPGQLEEELHHHGWHATDGSAAILFDTPRENRWSATWRAAGVDPAHLATDTGHAWARGEEKAWPAPRLPAAGEVSGPRPDGGA